MVVTSNDVDENVPTGIIPDWRVLVDHYYGSADTAREILVSHSAAVARLALAINRRSRLGLNPLMVEYAAMVHDIGIFMTCAPPIGCSGDKPYIAHGPAGADILRLNGAPEWAARVAERHTGSGLTSDEIVAQNLPLPTDRVLAPQSTLEKLICYADKFFSKRPGFLDVPKPIERVRAEMTRHGCHAAGRFESLHQLFGVQVF